MIPFVLSENVKLMIAAAGRGKQESIGNYIIMLLIEAQKQAENGKVNFMFCGVKVEIYHAGNAYILMTNAELYGIKNNIKIPCRVITLEREEGG